MVALEAQTGRRERRCSSPEAGSGVQPHVETSPGRTPRPAPSPAAAPLPTNRAARRRRSAPPAGTAPPPTRVPGTGSDRPADPGAEVDPAADRGDPSGQVGRRRASLLALCVVATASAAALVAGLTDWTPEPADPARPPTMGEAERLAAMRVTNYRDVRSGVRVTVGAGATRTELVGWVDWARPLVYLDVAGPGAGADRGLVQATPSAVVARPAPGAAATPATPPLVPPMDRWRLRELPTGRGLAAVLDLLLDLGADRPEPPAARAAAGARWLGRDTAGGTPVDIIQAPLHPAATGGASPPATVADRVREPRFWLDRDARLHRLAGRLPDQTPVTVDLVRSDRPTLRPVDALGGRPGLPRALTDGEADRLARLPARLRAAGGATVTLTAPLGPTANLRGAGWLSWAGSTGYLAVAEVDTPGRRTLLRYRAGRLARAEIPTAARAAEIPARPPLPPPAGVSWSPAAPVRDDLDRLVDAALREGGTPVAARAAVRLRGDRVADRSVDVIELRVQRAVLRYWIDRAGLLRRLELRTRRGVWAQLDLSPGKVPALPTAGSPASGSG
ncbi:hypothetical protein GA0070624_5787 [Micromonospora rhizosphaerae]|uniref:Uncharacterized protein n=1 Tax=Micromonospora rhizosphaerae TaxID=568872 RepID=A0A1C6T5Y9_9ACTN|nr:hypothetical protein [Micromonospora rhizosphaerae]SCL37191.1 hypothetical protein GA0070624_5787 [Micromonospora rhizosphaerae]